MKMQMTYQQQSKKSKIIPILIGILALEIVIVLLLNNIFWNGQNMKSRIIDSPKKKNEDYFPRLMKDEITGTIILFIRLNRGIILFVIPDDGIIYLEDIHGNTARCNIYNIYSNLSMKNFATFNDKIELSNEWKIK